MLTIVGKQFNAVQTHVLLNQDISIFENPVDPDQQASDKYGWSGFTLSSHLTYVFAYLGLLGLKTDRRQSQPLDYHILILGLYI